MKRRKYTTAHTQTFAREHPLPFSLHRTDCPFVCDLILGYFTTAVIVRLWSTRRHA